MVRKAGIVFLPSAQKDDVPKRSDMLRPDTFAYMLTGLSAQSLMTCTRMSSRKMRFLP